MESLSMSTAQQHTHQQNATFFGTRTYTLFPDLKNKIGAKQYHEGAALCAQIGEEYLGRPLNNEANTMVRLGVLCLKNPSGLHEIWKPSLSQITELSLFIRTICPVLKEIQPPSSTPPQPSFVSRLPVIQSPPSTTRSTGKNQTTEIMLQLQILNLLVHVSSLNRLKYEPSQSTVPINNNREENFLRIFTTLSQVIKQLESSPDVGKTASFRSFKEILSLYSSYADWISYQRKIPLTTYMTVLNPIASSLSERHAQVLYACLLRLQHRNEQSRVPKAAMNVMLQTFVNQIKQVPLGISDRPTLKEMTYLGDLAYLLHQIASETLNQKNEKEITEEQVVQILFSLKSTHQSAEKTTKSLLMKRDEATNILVNYLENHVQEGWLSVYSEWIALLINIGPKDNPSPKLFREKWLTFIKQYALPPQDELTKLLITKLENKPID